MFATYTPTALWAGFPERVNMMKAVDFTITSVVTRLSSRDLDLTDGGLGFTNYDAVVVINDLTPIAAHGVERWPGSITRPLFYGEDGTLDLHIDPFWLQPALFAHEVLHRNLPLNCRIPSSRRPPTTWAAIVCPIGSLPIFTSTTGPTPGCSRRGLGQAPRFKAFSVCSGDPARRSRIRRTAPFGDDVGYNRPDAMTDPRDDRPDPDQSLVLSYLGLRKAIGIIGTTLPFVLALGKIVLGNPGIQPSMSAYYDTKMGDVFVGIALFPTTEAGKDITFVGLLHYVCAASFFLALACVALAALGGQLPKGSSWQKLDPLFWFEATAVVAFGVSWLTKGEAFLKD